MAKKAQRLIPLSRIAPKKSDVEDMNSVKASLKFDHRRGFDILLEAQRFWDKMDNFRRNRERNKRYTYGAQWDDIICVDGESMTEEEYIKSQGNIPLKNNLIRRLVRNVLGVYRSQSKEPTCVARDRDEQKLSETMSVILQCNMQLNKMAEVNARTMEEFLISGFVVHRKSYGWRNGKQDCWTDYVQPNNFFIDNNMRDFRGWDVSVVGEVHDITFGQLCEQFASNAEDYATLKRIYTNAARRDYVESFVADFGQSKIQNYDFLFSSEQGRCRVIEVWRKEQKARYRCHDYLNGEVYKVEVADYKKMVVDENNSRIEQAKQSGMAIEDVPLIDATWFIDNYWYFYYITPFGQILREGETPFDHESHPYVFKAYPFIDGEIHSFVGDVIDQQRYTNRLVTMYDWIMRASAKGVLLMPEDGLADGMSMEDVADRWSKFNGVIPYKPNKSNQLPKQVSNNSTNIGISELLNMQLQFFEEISGVSAALQGRPGFSGESAKHYNAQTENATRSLLDLLDSFSGFVVDGAYKDIKNIQQFYDSKRVFNIAGKSGAQVEYDPNKIRDIEFDLSITESTSTPAYRHLANDILMQLWQSQAINVEMLLEHGDFPFADELLQSIKSQKEQVAQGQAPSGIPPELMQQAQQGVDMQAVAQGMDAIRQ